MHELGILFNVVRTVEDFARKNEVTRIAALVLQVGELSPVVPHYLEACYPAAVDGTLLEGAELKIEVTPGSVRCEPCQRVFNLRASQGKCPHCGAKQYKILSGQEFLIKEILAC